MTCSCRPSFWFLRFSSSAAICWTLLAAFCSDFRRLSTVSLCCSESDLYLFRMPSLSLMATATSWASSSLWLLATWRSALREPTCSCSTAISSCPCPMAPVAFLFWLSRLLMFWVRVAISRAAASDFFLSSRSMLCIFSVSPFCWLNFCKYSSLSASMSSISRWLISACSCSPPILSSMSLNSVRICISFCVLACLRAWSMLPLTWSRSATSAFSRASAISTALECDWLSSLNFASKASLCIRVSSISFFSAFVSSVKFQKCLLVSLSFLTASLSCTSRELTSFLSCALSSSTSPLTRLSSPLSCSFASLRTPTFDASSLSCPASPLRAAAVSCQRASSWACRDVRPFSATTTAFSFSMSATRDSL
mmetsp:Transcript_7458/g.15497  ORF Transcript_7458/g.15497 Transcript_7458/m.15497 type:complete len:366 (+) Transcript_7458:905-2002(+)